MKNALIEAARKKVSEELEAVWGKTGHTTEQSTYEPVKEPQAIVTSTTEKPVVVEKPYVVPPKIIPVLGVDVPDTALPPLKGPLKHEFHPLTCPHGELMEFWKPATAADVKYVSPYVDPARPNKYVIFEPGQCLLYVL